jgi:secreted Zn-dependent insulinase-like peptidase
VFSEGNVVYYLIYVQGNSKQPDYMDYRIEHVVSLMRKRINKVTSDDLKKEKQTIIASIAKKDMSLKERSLRLWDEIVTGTGYFDIKNIYKKSSKKITKAIILEKFDEIFNTKLSKLSIQEYNKNKIEKYERGKPVHGFKPVLVKNEDILRQNNKFMETC